MFLISSRSNELWTKEIKQIWQFRYSFSSFRPARIRDDEHALVSNLPLLVGVEVDDGFWLGGKESGWLVDGLKVGARRDVPARWTGSS